jgi:sugar O-acyltransferase (sialic acid O-acetyltransferase NeuD family)
LSNKQEKIRLVLIGARLDGQAGVVLDILRQRKDVEVVAFLDNSHGIQGAVLNGIPVIGSADKMDNLDFKGIDAFHISIGDNKARYEIYNDLKQRQMSLFTVVHPSAVISKTALIGDGCFIGANAVIQNNVRIGNVTLLNTASIIEHDNVIGHAVHVAPRVCTAGRVKINDLAFIGIGSTIIPDIEIGKSAFIGAGSVIVKDVSPEKTMIGYAAKEHDKNIYLDLNK